MFIRYDDYINACKCIKMKEFNIFDKYKKLKSNKICFKCFVKFKLTLIISLLIGIKIF